MIRPVSFKSSKKAVLGLLGVAVLAQGMGLAYGLGRHKAEEPMPTLQKTIYKTEIVVQQADDVLKEIDTLDWKPVPADADGLTLKTLLASTEKNNPQMLLKGENTVIRQSIRQQALYDSITGYTSLVKLWMNQVVLYHQLRVKQKDLLTNVASFEQGQTTSIAVLRDQSALIDTYRQLKATRTAYVQASQALAIQSGLDPKILYYPKALTYENDRYHITLPAIASASLTEKDAEKLAEQNQPDLRQLEVSRDEFRMKFLGLSTITPTGAVHMKDLEQLVKQARKAAQGVAHNVYQQLEEADKETDRAFATLQLAEKAYYQVQVSFESGFSSEKDIQEVALLLAKAQADNINALAGQYALQALLVKEIGLLNVKNALAPLETKVITSALKSRSTQRILNERNHDPEPVEEELPADEPVGTDNTHPESDASP